MRQLAETARCADVPVVHLTAAPSSADAGAELRVGKPFGPLELLGAARLAVPGLYEQPTAAVDPTAEEQLALLTHDLRRAVEDGEACRVERDHGWVGTAFGLVDVLALRDIETSHHSFRVQSYARELAYCVDASLLADSTVELGFLLHDVGKLALPDSILFKPGPLTAAEREVMQNHPVLGAEMVAGILPGGGQAVATVRSHHERWDGRGYPDGLRAQEIPLAARVFAVADTLDALTSDRPYRCGRPWAEAIETIEAHAGSQFDPDIVAALSPCASATSRGLTSLPASRSFSRG